MAKSFVGMTKNAGVNRYIGVVPRAGNRLLYLVLGGHMAKFTVRVELHSASYSDYETLHAAMECRGFSRFITSDDGKTYHLPTAEYDRSGVLTRQQVLESAKVAAAETGKSFEVLVTESDGRTWYGLQAVAVRSQLGQFR
jgi:hypothetical protein